MNVLDLFSGIGGFSLGLERAGMRTVAFCEIDPFCQRVLAKHWPGVPCYNDIRTLTADRLRSDGIAADVICGGFPCQDISFAGAGAGLDGERSGLWFEYARIIGELRPIFVIVENVTALLSRGIDRVLGDLSALGYDAEWHCIPASAAGAPHQRDRVWIVAYANGRRDAALEQIDTTIREPDGRGEEISNADRPRLEGWLRKILRERSQERSTRQGDPRWIGQAWLAEPDVGRVADGIPARVDRLKGLGNAVVPQISELIGRAIMKASMVTSQDRGTP